MNRGPHRRRCGVALLVGACLACAATAQPQAPSAPRPRWALNVEGCELAERDAWLPRAAELLLYRRLRGAPPAVLVPPERIADAQRELAENAAAPRSTAELATALGATHILQLTLHGTPAALELDAVLLALPGRTSAAAVTLTARFPEVLTETAMRLVPLGLPAPDDDGPPSAWEYVARAIDAERAGDIRAAAYFAKLATDRGPALRPALLRLTELELRHNPQRTRPLAAARLALVAELARAAPDPFDAVAAELAAAKLARASGDSAAALDRGARAVAAADELGEPYLNLAALSAMCDLTLSEAVRPELAGPHRAAALRRTAREALEWQRLVVAQLDQLGDQLGSIGAAAKLAMLHEQAGDLAGALEWAERARDGAERLQLPRAAAAAWMQIAQIHRRRVNGVQAVAAMQHVLELAPDGDQPAARIALAEALLLTQDAAAASAAYQTAYEQLQREQRELALQLTCLRELSTLAHALGRRDDSIRWLRRAIDVAHALRSPDEADLRQRLERLASDRQ